MTPRLHVVPGKGRRAMPPWIAQSLAVQHVKEWRERKSERRAAEGRGKTPQSRQGAGSEIPRCMPGEANRDAHRPIPGPGSWISSSSRRSLVRSLRGWLSLLVLLIGGAACGLALSPEWQIGLILVMANAAIVAGVFVFDRWYGPESPGRVTSSGKARQ